MTNNTIDPSIDIINPAEDTESPPMISLFRKPKTKPTAPVDNRFRIRVEDMALAQYVANIMQPLTPFEVAHAALSIGLTHLLNHTTALSVNGPNV